MNWYFHTSQNNPYQLDPALLYPLVDDGRLDTDSQVLQRWIDLQGSAEVNAAVRKNLAEVLAKHPEFGSTDLVNFAPVKIPTDICPVVNWNQPSEEWVNFNADVSGPRGWKDEYNEWVVTRDASGNITKISFTAENPEYWFTLWNVDPKRVLELYREAGQRTRSNSKTCTCAIRTAR